MKFNRSSAVAAIALASLTLFVLNIRGASVGSLGYTNNFSSLPPASDWSHLSVAGGAGDITSAAGLTRAASSTSGRAKKQILSVQFGVVASR